MPAVAIAFRENTKPFGKTDSVFNKDTFPKNLVVIFAFLFGQRMIFGTLFRQKRIGVYLSKPLVADYHPFRQRLCYFQRVGVYL